MQLFKRFVLVATIFSAMYADKQRDIMLPDLSVRLLDGKQVRLSALLEEGPLLVSFWATWCAPCKKEMIFLEEFHQKYNENSFRVLAISTDSPKSMSKVKSYIRAKKYTFLVGIDPNQEIAKKMNALLMPTTLILNKDRKVSWYHQGFIPGDEKEIEAQIRAVLYLDQEKAVE
ncbi:MAG TPA: TlpA family protein disulfide reductase [Candidatus Marinimicrobia bacterium]|jgi:thiol-disulfide isomerase/thioredoxin|nr:TlpA family protein disulfide reductase [Candidatus Neomarinimicrobiota bacterium]